MAERAERMEESELVVGSKETASSGHNKFDNTYGSTVTVAAHRRPTQVQP